MRINKNKFLEAMFRPRRLRFISKLGIVSQEVTEVPLMVARLCGCSEQE